MDRIFQEAEGMALYYQIFYPYEKENVEVKARLDILGKQH